MCVNTITNTNETYNVFCLSCDQVFTPVPRSPLWWQAKQRDDRGFLDALTISGEKCGCKPKIHKPHAPFRVLGYDDMCTDFDTPCDTFIKAVKLYRKLVRYGWVVFISGVSLAVQHRIELGPN